jgi:O-antigen/teichoic acid export membrane protein
MGYDLSSCHKTKLNSVTSETMPGDTNVEVGSRRSLLINSTSILFARLVTTCVSLISVPIVLNKLGVVGYGTWESILALSLLSNVFQGMIIGTLLWKISQAHGARDNESIQVYVRIGIWFSLALFFIICPVMWAGRYFFVDLFQVPENLRDSAAVILPSVVGLMLLGCMNEVIGALLAGFQRAGLTTLIQAAASTLNNLIVILCLLAGLSLWSLLIGFATGLIASAVALYAAAKMTFKALRILPLIPKSSTLIGLAPYAGFMLLHSVSAALRDQTDKVVLSSIASPLWTGYFGIAARLAGVVPLISSFFYVPTIAAAGALSGRGDSKAIHRLYDDAMRMTSVSVGLFAVLIAGLHDRILMLWLGKAMPEVSLLLYLLLGGYAFAVIMTGAGTAICKGTGRVKMEATYIAAGFMMNIVLKFALVPLVGPIGTLAASTISWVLSAVFFVFLMHRGTDLPTSATMKGCKTVIICVVSVVLARLISSEFPPGEGRCSILLDSVLFGCLIGGLYCFLAVWLGILPLRKIIGQLLAYTGKSAKGRS